LIAAGFGSIEQAVASLSVFSHPQTVQQTNNSALFRIRRYRPTEKRGQVIDEERVVLCDNQSPTSAFLWANNLTRRFFEEVQYNHIYQKSDDPRYYTSLANICVTPAFLSKLTDTNPEIKQLLKYRVSTLYNFIPEGEPQPPMPHNYNDITWADCLPSCNDLQPRLIDRLQRNQESRIALSVEHFGWLFGQV